MLLQAIFPTSSPLLGSQRICHRHTIALPRPRYDRMIQTSQPSAKPTRFSECIDAFIGCTLLLVYAIPVVCPMMSAPLSRLRIVFVWKRSSPIAGVLQADAYSGFNPLLDPERAQGPITPALCWAHSRRKFFELADLKKQARSKKQLQISPMALEAVKRIDPCSTSSVRSMEDWPKSV